MRARVLAALAGVAMLVAILFLWHEGPAPEERSPRGGRTEDEPALPEARDAAVPETRAAGEFRRELLVRDLADGSPLARFRLRVGSEALETDDAGRLLLSATSGGPLAADPPFVLFRSAETLWVHGRVRVRGRVSGRGTRPFDPLRASIGAEWENGTEPPWTMEWLSAAGVSLHELGAAKEDGTFEIDLPRVRGFVVRASAEGWREASAEVVVGATTETVEVDLVLVPGFRVRGRVAGARGPVAGATVLVYLLPREPVEGVGADESGVTWGRTVRRYTSNGEGKVVLSFAGATDPQGRFDLDVDAEGEGLLWIQHAGYATFHRDLGVLGGEASGIDVALEEGGGARVRVLRDGRRAPETTLYLTDLDLPRFLPTFLLRTDAEGNVPADWLVAGHRYAVIAQGVRGPRELAWTGQAEIDVAALAEARTR